jgi:hypothetical protein
MTQFIIHPRTPEEAKDEFLTDLRRRREWVEHDIAFSKTKTGEDIKRYLLLHFDSMIRFWQEVQIQRPVRDRKPKARGKKSAGVVEHLVDKFVDRKEG